MSSSRTPVPPSSWGERQASKPCQDEPAAQTPSDTTSPDRTENLTASATDALQAQSSSANTRRSSLPLDTAPFIAALEDTGRSSASHLNLPRSAINHYMSTAAQRSRRHVPSFGLAQPRHSSGSRHAFSGSFWSVPRPEVPLRGPACPFHFERNDSCPTCELYQPISRFHPPSYARTKYISERPTYEPTGLYSSYPLYQPTYQSHLPSTRPTAYYHHGGREREPPLSRPKDHEQNIGHPSYAYPSAPGATIRGRAEDGSEGEDLRIPLSSYLPMPRRGPS